MEWPPRMPEWLYPLAQRLQKAGDFAVVRDCQGWYGVGLGRDSRTGYRKVLYTPDWKQGYRSEKQARKAITFVVKQSLNAHDAYKATQEYCATTVGEAEIESVLDES